MKKFFVGVLAIASLVACAQEETIRSQAPASISFENAFVQGTSSKPVRAIDPSITTETIDAFDVWGYMDANTGVVFDKERVVKTETGWAYENLAYWAPSHTYYFAALAPVDHSNIVLTLADDGKYMKEQGLGTVAFTNIDGTDDLLYSKVVKVVTPAEIAAEPEPVKLLFRHLLSKVKFTFKNGFTNANTTLKVSDIQMVVPGYGTIDLTKDPYSWVVTEDVQTATLLFGDASTAEGDAIIPVLGAGVCADERLTIPVASTQTLKAVYEISFNVTLLQGDQVAYEGRKKTTIENITLEIGKAYNFVATLNHKNVADSELYPIEFEAEVEDWVIDTAINDSFVIDGGVVDTETVK